MRRRARRWIALTSASVVAVGAAVAAGVTAAEDLASVDLTAAASGEEATPAELEAWHLLQVKPIEAREKSEAVIAGNPQSFVGHFVLGSVYYLHEANFPRALFHVGLALKHFEERFGREPGPDVPWLWHLRILRILAAVHGDLEHHVEKLALLERHNELYSPKMLAEEAWPLMKLKRFREARVAAEMGLSTGEPMQTEIALNALCAVEFEAGNDGRSYDACRRALDYARNVRGVPNAVDFTNYAEAARSLFKLDEAEEMSVEASRAPPAWYGNPWIDLAELYTREGRFPEALQALKEVPRYRSARPPHVRDADRNEGRRALSSFFLVVGRPADALRITEKALVAPDRRAHNSRDPVQDLTIAALLDRRARLLMAEQELEAAAAEPWYSFPKYWFKALWGRFQAWMSGRQAAKLLSDDEHLIGVFRIGTSESAIMAPWLAGELGEVVGPGVVRQSIAKARRKDRRPGAGAYYDAFEAEAALVSGDDKSAVRLAERSIARLGSEEQLLRSRVHIIAAEALRSMDQLGRAGEHYEQALAVDPGVARRFGLALPVSVVTEGGSQAAVVDEVISALGDSPRVDWAQGSSLTLRVRGDATGARVCLLAGAGAVLGCGEATLKAGDDAKAIAFRAVRAFHRDVFAPRIDLSQAGANSLDGSMRVTRNPLETLFGDPGDSPEVAPTE